MDNIFQPLMDWIKTAIKDTLQKLLDIEAEKDGFPELLNITDTCQFLGIGETTFNNNYRYMSGFPKELPAKRWSKRAIKKWLENQL